MPISLLQIRCAGTAKIQECVGIPLSINIQITRPGLAPFAHVIRRISELQMHLCPFVNHIAGVVELVRGTRCRLNRVAAALELSITSPQIYRGIEHDGILLSSG